jgi:DNA-binding response OmpR family regulator
MTGTRPQGFTILSVSPASEDHCVLENILSTHGPVINKQPRWKLSIAMTLSSALDILNRICCTAVICERDLPVGSWKDLLEQTQQLPKPPSLIVTSRHADERLWAEALNLGAYDVLAKPFDANEILHVVGLACGRWDEQSTAETEQPR